VHKKTNPVELLFIIILFMVCVKVVAFRKDVRDMSKRENMQSAIKKTRPQPVIETNKSQQQTISNVWTKR